MKTVIRNNKGFTLIEMAIVLVIIGVIIGAVVKGQDMITNAHAKQVTSSVNTWRSLAYAYMDRNGRLPGDISRNGVIGNDATTEQIDAGTATAEIVNTMQNAPANPVVIGSMTFWAYFGNVPGVTGTRNAMVICKAADCDTEFTADEIEIIKSIDTAIDGSADGAFGQLRAVTDTPILTTGLAAQNGRDNNVVTTATVLDKAVTPTTSIAWTAGTHKAAVWAFDRPF